MSMLSWLAALAVFVLLTWAHLHFWVRRLGRPLAYDETVRIATPDGSAFELRHLGPAPPAADLPPVLMVHGIAVNHRNLDAWADWSLARRLTSHGRDVWLLTLRSGRHDLTAQERATVRFQAMVEHDVPLAVAEVLRRTGAQHLDYVGFSMGGMLLYAALGSSLPEAQVRRVAIMGSPGRVVSPLPVPRWAARLRHPTLPLRVLSRLVAFLGETILSPLHPIVLNLRNTQPGLAKLTMVDGVADIPGPLLGDFAQWVTSGGVLTVAGRPVLDGLRKVHVSVHFFVGAADKLGPPKAVRLVYDAWGADTGAQKRFTVFGTAAGHVADYGHVDLALGRSAPTEVFPCVVDFLSAPDALPAAA